MSMIEWNDDNVARLKRDWKAGLSAGMIAVGFGSLAYRNAVIGKIHRLNLSGRAKAPSGPKRVIRGQGPRMMAPLGPAAPAAASAKPQRPRDEIDPAITRGIQRKIARATDPFDGDHEATDLPPDQSPDAVTFADLKPDQCKHPLGDPRDREGFRFCGSPRFGRESYCARHCRLNYTAAQGRRINAYDPSAMPVGRKPTAGGGVMGGNWT